MDADAVIADLYAKPLDEFTPQRDRLAKELKAAGDDDAAKRVKALRKPTVPVWAVNRLAATQANDLDELLDLGNRLREAHAQLLGGGDATQVRDLAAEERDVVARLTDHAKALLEAAGQKPTPATLERISGTLLGLATDSEAATAARAARLDREVTRGGFDDADSFDVEAAGPATATAGDGRAQAGPSPAAIRRAREAASKARAHADELAARADKMAREAEELASQAARAASRAETAREAAEAAAGKAGEAEREAAGLEG